MLNQFMWSMLLSSPTPKPGEADFSSVVEPIIELLNAIIIPALTLVGAIGAIYCIVLGVKFAKADEQQEREKAKNALKNAIIGFVLIFVLMVALNLGLPIMQTWMEGQI